MFYFNDTLFLNLVCVNVSVTIITLSTIRFGLFHKSIKYECLLGTTVQRKGEM